MNSAIPLIEREVNLRDPFDVGVISALQGREFRPGTPEFGQAFETYLMHKLSSYRDYISSELLSH